MPHDKLYLDTILSVPGLLSSHRDWHQAQDTILPALLGQDRCFLRASHPAQKTPSASTCTRRVAKYSWCCFPARSKTQAVTEMREVLNRDRVEEEVSRHKSVIYSNAVQALTAAETPVKSQVPTASPSFTSSNFHPTALWTVTHPGSAGGEQSQHQAQPALAPSHAAAPAWHPFAGKLSKQSFRHQCRTQLELTSLNGGRRNPLKNLPSFQLSDLERFQREIKGL